MNAMAAWVRRMGRLGALAAMVLAAGAASAQIQSTPWSYFIPADIHMPPLGGKAVVLASPQPGSGDVSIPAAYYKPDSKPDKAADASRGAVVLVNSAAGWSDAREGHYARALRSAGYAVLAIDSYGPRGIAGTLTDNARLAYQVQWRDALAARRFLIGNGHRADRIAIMGSGRGGTVALLAADEGLAAPGGAPFDLAIAVAPACLFHPIAPKPAAPVFMAVGDQDAIGGTRLCRDLATDLQRAGGQVVLRAYPDASSDFDGHADLLRKVRETFAETLATCSVPVDAQGMSMLGNRRFGESDFPALMAELRATCMGHGAVAWTNVTQKVRVTIDVIEFLDANFRR